MGRKFLSFSQTHNIYLGSIFIFCPLKGGKFIIWLEGPQIFVQNRGCISGGGGVLYEMLGSDFSVCQDIFT